MWVCFLLIFWILVSEVRQIRRRESITKAINIRERKWTEIVYSKRKENENHIYRIHSKTQAHSALNKIIYYYKHSIWYHFVVVVVFSVVVVVVIPVGCCRLKWKPFFCRVNFLPWNYSVTFAECFRCTFTKCVCVFNLKAADLQFCARTTKWNDLSDLFPCIGVYFVFVKAWSKPEQKCTRSLS